MFINGLIFKFGFILLIFILKSKTSLANTECFWATGIIKCQNDQSKVANSTVEVYDLDSPQGMNIRNPFDPDDKAGVSIVDKEDGLFMVDGCASDQDWIPGIRNRPEFYIKIHHYCLSKTGNTKIVLPVFRVYTPNTYDYHINHPIILDG